MKKNIIFIAVMLTLGCLSFSYEDFYEKVYTMKLSKKELFREIKATEKQQKRLNKIFEDYQKKAENVNRKVDVFEKKKAELGKVEQQRYEKIAEVLNDGQLAAFNSYMIENKLKFTEKNDRIKNLMDSLNLTNNQEAQILKFDGHLKRQVEKMKGKYFSEKTFFEKYYSLRDERNEKIKGILNDEQKKIIESAEF